MIIYEASTRSFPPHVGIGYVSDIDMYSIRHEYMSEEYRKGFCLKKGFDMSYAVDMPWYARRYAMVRRGGRGSGWVREAVCERRCNSSDRVGLE